MLCTQNRTIVFTLRENWKVIGLQMLKLNYLKRLLLAVWMITGLFAEFSLIQHILIEYLLWSIFTLLKYMYTSWTEGKYLD